jgi:hypothetical protein
VKGRAGRTREGRGSERKDIGKIKERRGGIEKKMRGGWKWNKWSCKLYLEGKVQLRHFYKKQII